MSKARDERLREVERRWEAQTAALTAVGPPAWAVTPRNRRMLAEYWLRMDKRHTLGMVSFWVIWGLLFAGGSGALVADPIAESLGHEYGVRAALTTVGVAGTAVLGLTLPSWRRQKGAWKNWLILAGALGATFLPGQWKLALATFAMLVGVVLAGALLGVPLSAVIERALPVDFRAYVTVRTCDALAMMTFGRAPRLGDEAPIVENRSRWTDGDGRSALAGHLEGTSRALLRREVRTVPLPWTAATRSGMRDYQRRVAAGFAALALEVTLADQSRNDDVYASVAAGYAAAQAGQWHALATVSPTGVQQAALRRFAERAVTVALLGGLAVWVIPELTFMSPDDIKLARTITLGAALVALTSPRRAIVTIRDQVVGALSAR